MDKEIGIIIGKVILSFLALILAILLGAAINESLLGPRPAPTLSFMFLAALVYPIWYPSKTQIPKRLMAALIGSIVGFGFWSISHALPIGSGSGMVLVAGAFRGGAFIVALIAEWLILVSRDGVVKPEQVDKSVEQDAQQVFSHGVKVTSKSDRVTTAVQTQKLETSTHALGIASNQTYLSHLKSGSTGAVLIFLSVVSLIVGVVLSVLGLNPYDIINTIKTLAPRIYIIFSIIFSMNTLEWIVRYFLLGAIVVFPIWLIAWLIVRIIKMSKGR